jgi:hypothetical protein
MRRPILAMLLVLPTVMAAQDSALRQAAPRTLCFVPRNLPRCQSNILVEFGGGAAVLSSVTSYTRSGGYARRTDFEKLFYTGLGVSRNIGGHSALGVVGMLNIDRLGSLGVDVRYRRWSGATDSGVELIAGYANHEVNRHNDCTPGPPCAITITAHGFATGVNLVFGPYVQFFTRGHFLYGDGEWRNAIFSGATVTSHASYSTVATAAGLLLILFLINPPVN